MVEVLASETRLDGPESLWNSSNGEVEKPQVESPRPSLVARDVRSTTSLIHASVYRQLFSGYFEETVELGSETGT